MIDSLGPEHWPRALRTVKPGGRIIAVLDSVLPLGEAAEAHRRVETGRSRGKVVSSCV